MADDELRRVPPGIAAKVGRNGNLGGNAGIVLVPLWDGGLFLFSPRAGYTILTLDWNFVYF